MNIVLTGLRGSGKATIGKLLAEKLNWNFIDIDNEIEKEENMTIKNIVELRGWEYFRAVENKVTKEISKTDQTIISTGGGTIIDKDNEKELKKNGKVIYLYVKPEVCAERIKNSKKRPALDEENDVFEELKYTYRKRNDRYIKSSNKIFHRTDNPEKDAIELINTLL